MGYKLKAEYIGNRIETIMTKPNGFVMTDTIGNITMYFGGRKDAKVTSLDPRHECLEYLYHRDVEPGYWLRVNLLEVVSKLTGSVVRSYAKVRLTNNEGVTLAVTPTILSKEVADEEKY